MQVNRISQFTVNTKHTPETLAKTQEKDQQHYTCQFCADNLAVTTQLRKKEILLELQIQNQRQTIGKLQKQNNQLIQNKVITYHQYQQRMEREQMCEWNRQDMEAELFELKIVNELLLLSKTNHPQIKQFTDQSLKQKYSDLLIETIKMQEKIEARDRIIAEKEYFPLYHYDQRVSTLRKAVAFWYRKAEEDCNKMRAKFKDLKLRLQQDSNSLRQQVEIELQVERDKLMRVIDGLNLGEQQSKIKRKNKKNSLVQSIKQPKKTASKKQEIKKFR